MYSSYSNLKLGLFPLANAITLAKFKSISTFLRPQEFASFSTHKLPILSSSTSSFNRPTIECPVESCHGVLSKENKCIVCGVQVCDICHVIMSKNHVCKPEDIATVKMLESSDNTKKCPKCPAYVYRTEGCNHMYCMNCKTGFDWVTGRILSNAENTNPHMFDDLRNNGIVINRNTGDCNDALDRTLFEEIVKGKFRKYKREDVSRMINEFLGAERIVMMLSVNYIGTFLDYIQVRIHNSVLYLLGEISKEEFIDNMYRMYITNVRNTQIAIVIRTLRSLVIGFLHECMDPNTSRRRIREILYKEIPRVIKIINKEFFKIEEILSSKYTLMIRKGAFGEYEYLTENKDIVHAAPY